MQFLETKRKRHEPNPISKSAGISGLLNVIERNQGMLMIYFGLGLHL